MVVIIELLFLLIEEISTPRKRRHIPTKYWYSLTSVPPFPHTHQNTSNFINSSDIQDVLNIVSPR